MTRILIIGSGVVGQATGKGFAKKGHSVSYVDINPQRKLTPDDRAEIDRIFAEEGVPTYVDAEQAV